MDRVEAYKTVFDDLMKIRLFRGIYDAKNGKEDFMYGILTVIEFIAKGISGETQDTFVKQFYKEMERSELKVHDEK